MTSKIDCPKPVDLRPTVFDGRTAIIAGNGALPVSVVNTLRASGNNPLVLAIRGEASDELYCGDYAEIEVVDLGRVVKLLKTNNIRNVVMAGGVRQRPRISSIKPDFATLAVVPRFFRALGQGDDRLLRAVIGVLESYGFRVLGAHQIVPDLLTPEAAQMTLAKPGDRNIANIALACEAALAIGHLDVGQGAVAVGGRVVALEGAEGTDAMLERVEQMRLTGRIPQSGGVLVKCAKPNQDERADLPAIGTDTVVNAKRAKLDGIAVEARRTLILDFGKTIETANKLDIFITSFPPQEA
ncbi:MAG: LpxI family protein [Phyllobacterium sp.]